THKTILMNLPIKGFALAALLCCGPLCFAQDVTQDIVDPEDTLRISNMKNHRPRLLALSLDLYQPIPSGNKYVGKAMKGKTSFNVNAQLYVYRNFFIKASIGETYFEVENRSVVGNYQKTSFSNQSLSVGYEFLPLDKFRLGLSLSVLGASDHLNKVASDTKGIQRDNAKLKAYEMYLDYELLHYLAVSAHYSYRNDRTNIVAP